MNSHSLGISMCKSMSIKDHEQLNSLDNTSNSKAKKLFLGGRTVLLSVVILPLIIPYCAIVRGIYVGVRNAKKMLTLNVKSVLKIPLKILRVPLALCFGVAGFVLGVVAGIVFGVIYGIRLAIHPLHFTEIMEKLNISLTTRIYNENEELNS